MENVVPFGPRNSGPEKELTSFEKIEKERMAARSKNMDLKQEEIALREARTNKIREMSRETDQKRRDALRDDIDYMTRRINLLPTLIRKSWLAYEKLNTAYEEAKRLAVQQEYREAA